jgi:hypothetical protein
MNELLVMYSLNDTVKVVVGGSYLHIKRENLDKRMLRRGRRVLQT